MQVYKARDFYFYLFLGAGVLLIGMFLFSIMFLDQTIYMLLFLPVLMFARAVTILNKEILFLRDDHFEWSLGSIGGVTTVKYDSILNIKTPKSNRYAKLKVKEGDRTRKVVLQLEYLEKEERQEVVSFLRSKSTNLVAA